MSDERYREFKASPGAQLCITDLQHLLKGTEYLLEIEKQQIKELKELLRRANKELSLLSVWDEDGNILRAEIREFLNKKELIKKDE